MHKIMLSLLCCVLILSGCSKSDSVNSRSTEWGYFYYPNTDWGMTEDELFSAIEKEKSDFAFNEAERNNIVTASYTGGCRIFGEKTKTKFTFSTSLISNTPRLIKVDLLYETDFTQKKCKNIMTRLDNLFKKQGIAVSDKWETVNSLPTGEDATFYSIESVARLTTLPQEIRDAYNQSVRAIYQSGEYPLPDIGDVSTIDFIKAHDSELSSARIIKNNEKDSGTVTITGNMVVAIEENVKAE